MNQIELEKEMAATGRAQVLAAYAKNEAKGRASSNPYTSILYRKTVEPLAQVIAAKYTKTDVHPSRRNRITAALLGVDEYVIAYLVMKTVADTLIDSSATTATALAGKIGQRLYGELLLRQFENIEPAMYHALVMDFKKRMSKSERHRINVFRHQAQKLGVTPIEWSTDLRIVVGLAMIHELKSLEIVSVYRALNKSKHTTNYVQLPEETLQLLSSVKEQVAMLSPCRTPCIEPPKDWASPMDGGWHTKDMRRISPSCINGRSFVAAEDVPQHRLDCLNRQQRVAWEVNRDVLEILLDVSKYFDMDEVVSQSETPKPRRPLSVPEGLSKEDMTEKQRKEFITWKRSVAVWYTESRQHAQKWGRFYRISRAAARFKEYDSLYFVYSYDYRGRMYAQSTGLSPQGSDLQKALIRFKQGGKLDTDQAVFWFKVNGANRYGFDTAPLQERADWVDQHHDFIMRMVQDPISFREWTEADSPFQFLAWCFEYAKWQVLQSNFVSHLPVALDGTCNGLQHLSAMLLDEVGGKATNLLPAKEKQDIYSIVAKVTTNILESEEEDERGYRSMWLNHGITRTLCKRSVMTLPYGATRFACSEFIVQDYLTQGLAPEFNREAYRAAATYLSHRLWGAIGKVVIKAREAMAWMQSLARFAIRSGAEEISWQTPDGFVVHQRYHKVHSRRIETMISGGIRLRPFYREYEEDTADMLQHVNGIVPNVTHGCDSAHMQLTEQAAYANGIERLAFIHDSFGTTPDKTEQLFRLIREAWYQMYSSFNPLEELLSKYPDFKGKLPENGTLDLCLIHSSQYFFC